jgi:mannosyltransferase
LLGSSAICAAILGVAIGLRAFELGRLSFWYDEVVTMRLAGADSWGALLDRLFQIDATRAPVHPMLLRAWLKVFGATEAAARSLSVVCGLATLVSIFLIGRAVFDAPTGLWAAWLGALSPVLVVYSREARMYAWLIAVTCFAWLSLLKLGGVSRPPESRSSRSEPPLPVSPPLQSVSCGAGVPPAPPVSAARTPAPRSARLFLRIASVSWTAAYGFSLVVLAYSHPLGLLMAANLALAGLIGARRCFGSLRRWMLIHLIALFCVLPWLGNYFDHPPEFLSGRQPLRFLLGVPIGFIGGDFRILAGLALLIALGLWRRSRRLCVEPQEVSPARDWISPVFLLLWFALPPMVLYLYARISYPIFGPARYTAFVAPAFLILVAAGLRQLPPLLRYPAAFLLALVSAIALWPLAYDPELKADWRGFAQAATQMLRARPGESALVIVASDDPTRNVEVETARYYLPESCQVLASGDATPERLEQTLAEYVYATVGSRRGKPVAPAPERLGGYEFHELQRFPGLIAFRGTRLKATRRQSSFNPGTTAAD